MATAADAEDQPERHHHDLIGQAHEGEADRGEQSDDRIADDGLGEAALARPAADQVGDNPGKEDADDDDQSAEDDLAAELGHLGEEDRDRPAAELLARPRSMRRE